MSFVANTIYGEIHNFQVIYNFFDTRSNGSNFKLSIFFGTKSTLPLRQHSQFRTRDGIKVAYSMYAVSEKLGLIKEPPFL